MAKLARLLVPFLLCLLPLCAQAAYRTGAAAGESTAGMSVATSAMTVVAGDTMVVSLYDDTTDAGDDPSCTDTYANTFTAITGSPFNISYDYIYVYTVNVTTGGASDVVTCTGADSLNRTLYVLDFSGRNNASLFDGTPIGAAETSYVQTHPDPLINYTVSDAGSDLVILYFTPDSSAATWTAGEDYTLGPNLTGSSATYNTGMTQYAASISTGVYTPYWYGTNYDQGYSVVLALKEASSSCTHYGLTSSGTLAIPNGSSGSYRGNSGSFVTPDCSSIEYLQTSGVFGTN